MRFENEWLSRYPRPSRCIHDQGPEFMGVDFQRILLLNGIKDVATTIKNPQANAVCERMHQTVTNILRPLLHAHFPPTAEAANDVIDTALATASYASRASLHRSLNVSPGALVFHRDMLLNIPLIADLNMIRERRQVLIDENLRRQNMKRRTFDYQVGQQVLVLNSKERPSKLEPRAPDGPFPIIQVHVNGNVTIQRDAYTTERINIRRLRPFRTQPWGFIATSAFLIFFLPRFYIFPWSLFLSHAFRHRREECSITGTKYRQWLSLSFMDLVKVLVSYYFL